MKQLRHIALIAALAFSGAANDASAQAISNVLIPPQTIVGNLQGSATGAQALRLCDVAVALSQAGYFVSTSAVSCSTAVPPTPGVPGNAVVFGPAPYPNVLADGGGPPILAGGTPSSLILTNATGLPIATGVSGLGTGVATALGINVGSAGSPVVNGGALGTPSAGVGTNLTGLNASNLSAGTLPPARTNGHMNGTATNDNAAAGEIGEYNENTLVNASAISLTNNTPVDVITVSLGAGDYDVWGVALFTFGGSTVITQVAAWISTTANTFPSIDCGCLGAVGWGAGKTGRAS